MNECDRSLLYLLLVIFTIGIIAGAGMMFVLDRPSHAPYSDQRQ
jgi:hypothetical protein